MVWGEKVVLDSLGDSVVEDIGAIQAGPWDIGDQVEIDLFDNVPQHIRSASGDAPHVTEQLFGATRTET